MEKKSPKVVSIDCRKDDGAPEPPSPSTQGLVRPGKRGQFYGNRHTEHHAIVLTLGPLDYSEERAAETSGHPLRKVREAVKNLARREFDRQRRLGMEFGRTA